ncbi:ParA family protein [Tautonia sociabilis]|uniref:ParA family protein n=1 Tax=Tautonia sociabilis TaxID=2080755 RepID=A0A432MET1_9BACT|nr:ParA family protein [Tautonia sociabilis]RUL84198.1 ParA family protein [Tautonia sociabilis]
MAVVAMVNQKGGVGKSSTTMHLGGALARRGLRVLVVDNDAQASLTKGLLGDDQARAIDPSTTVYALYAGVPTPGDLLVRPTGFDGLALLAGSPASISFNVPDPHLLDPRDQAVLRDALRPIAEGFDLTLIDCCPNLQRATWSALLAADAALIPTMPELFGAQGLAEVRDWVALVEQTWGRPLPVAGVLVTMFNGRRAMHRTFVELLAGGCPELLSSTVPESSDFPEAIAAGRPIHYHKARGAAAKAMDAVADEVLARLSALGLIPTATDDDPQDLGDGKEAA